MKVTTEKQKLADRLYQQFVTPLEKEYQGQYVAVSKKGGTIFGQSMLKVLQKASRNFGLGNAFVFKVGDQVVGKWR